MSKPNKQKIATNPVQSGLNDAFARGFGALDAKSLPPGPETNAASASAPAAPEKPAKLGRVLLRREKAHRGGKTVVIVHDFEPHIDGAFIENLAGKLRKSCGCGGTVRNREVEVQGDQPEKIRALLEKEGFRVQGLR